MTGKELDDMMSDDFYAYHWICEFATRWSHLGGLTSIGRRWLSRATWHLEEDVEAQLRAK